jgi:hypothetical protein
MTRATTNGHRTNGAVKLPDGENPLHWLTPEQSRRSVASWTSSTNR